MEEKKLNQILNTCGLSNEDSNQTPTRKKINFRFLKFQFVFCSVFAFVVTGYYFYLQYDKRQKENLSEEILRRFSITNLYENTNLYSASYVSNENIYQTDSLGFSVTGLIEIQSIGVYYPIINEFSYELLKIAPCKFLGPNPNEVRKLMYRWS